MPHFLHAAPGVRDITDQGGPGIFVKLPGCSDSLNEKTKGTI